MQVATEIQSNLKNLRYYSQKINALARQQLDLDVKRGHEIGIATGAGSIRFDSLGAIQSNCTWIETYCDNIRANLESAIKQDKLLHAEELEDALLTE